MRIVKDRQVTFSLFPFLFLSLMPRYTAPP